MSLLKFLTQKKPFFYLCIHTVAACVSKMIALILITAIMLIRPLLGPPNICPFTVGCTPFAIDQLSKQPLHRACIIIAQRLVQCHPFGMRR